MTAKDITPSEFGLLFLKYRERFIVIATSYVKDEIVAEDIVSSCFTNFWDNRARIQIDTVPEAYILQSIKNSCLNYMRNKANRLRIHEDRYKAAMAEIHILENENLGIIFRDDIMKIFQRLMERTPEMTRNIFCSSRFDDMTYQEIADKYNVTPRKVKREIQSVLKMMRDSLKDYLPLMAFPVMVTAISIVESISYIIGL